MKTLCYLLTFTIFTVPNSTHEITLKAEQSYATMKQRLLHLFFFTSLFIPAATAQNAPPIAPFSYTFEGKPHEDSLYVLNFAGAWGDATHALTIQNILAHDTLNWQIQPTDNDRHVYYWVRFRLINKTNDTIKRAIFTHSSFDYMNLYTVKNNVVADSIKRGRFAPLSIKGGFCHQRTFIIELPPQAQADYYFTYYFQIKRGFKDSIYLLNADHLSAAYTRKIEAENFDMRMDYFLFNFLIVLMFMTLIQYFIFPRNTAFLYYLGYLFFITFYYFNYNNIYYRYYAELDVFRPHFYFIEIITSYGCYAFYNLFIMQFSETGKSYPPLIKYSRIFNYLWLALIPIHWFTMYYVSISANHYLFIGFRIIALIASFYTFFTIIEYSKNKLNNFLFIGTSCLFLFVLRGTIETITEMFNFYPDNFFNNLDENYPIIGIRLGVILESIFFSIGLIFKGKQLAKEQQLKELNLQKQYIEQLEKTQDWQRKYQSELEQEIAIKAGQLAYFEREQAIEKTRSQIAQDIHDEVGGSFTKISLAAEVAARQTDWNGTALKERFEKLGLDARNAANSLREIIFAINPDYDNFSEMQAYFMEFAHNFWQNTPIEPVFDFEKSKDNPQVRPDIKRQLLLIFKEAQNNAAKYAQATTVHLTLKIVDTDHYLLIIQDNGSGFDPLSIKAKNGHSKGISGMKNRAESIDAQLVMQSESSIGTTISVAGKL